MISGCITKWREIKSKETKMASGVGSLTLDNDLADDGFNTGQIDDIFGDDDDIFNAPAPLPPLSPTHIGGGENEGEEVGDDKKPKKKVIIRSPQPKLDDIRLCSERGIPALKHLCDGIKFKGKGHEASDLNVLLQRFEHWAHRLYPKFTFEDCVEQIETMGKKKLVENTIKSVRRGDTGEVDDSDEELLMNGDKEIDDAAPSTTTSMGNASFGGQINVEASTAPVPQLGLTPEQLERIRLNREKAFAKRKQQQSQLASQTATQPESQDNEQPKSPSKDEDNVDKCNDLSDSSLEQNKLHVDNETDTLEVTNETMEKKVTENETMVTGVTQEETMGTGVAQNETMETGVTQNETMETGVAQNETMATGVAQNETMETGVTQNVTMETGVAQNETMATGVTQNETMETGVTQNETIETEVTQNETMENGETQNETTATNDTEKELNGDINANTMNNESMEVTQRETMVTKTKVVQGVNHDVIVTKVSANGIHDSNDDIIGTKTGDEDTMVTESEGKSKETNHLETIETATLDDIAMET